MVRKGRQMLKKNDVVQDVKFVIDWRTHMPIGKLFQPCHTENQEIWITFRHCHFVKLVLIITDDNVQNQFKYFVNDLII